MIRTLFIQSIYLFFCFALFGCAGQSTSSPMGQPLWADAAANKYPIEPDLKLDGVWHNQLSSQMALTYNPASHSLSGTYENHGGAKPPYLKRPLFGTVNGDVISFTVNWNLPESAPESQHYPTIATWVGQIYTDASTNTMRIRTVWVLGSPQTPDFIWNGVTTGSDVFDQGPSKE